VAFVRPEYAITVAVILVLLAIGVPAIRNESYIIGGACIGAAAFVVFYVVRGVMRERL
jgi:hypothetical protein